MTIRQKVRALSLMINKRRKMLRAYGLSQPRMTGILRLQIEQLESRRFGLTRYAAAQGKGWAKVYLRALQRMAAMPRYQRVDLPGTNYSPWYNTFPQTSYQPSNYFYPRQRYTAIPTKAGYHPYVKGQQGAQVPSHLSRFGIGALSEDDVEGVVEPIGLDGFGEMGMTFAKLFDFKNNFMGASLYTAGIALVASGLLGKKNKKAKQRTQIGAALAIAGFFTSKRGYGSADMGRVPSVRAPSFPRPGPTIYLPERPDQAPKQETVRLGMKTMINGY